MTRALFAALAFTAFATAAHAQPAHSNPFVQVYGPDVVIASAEVRYRDGVLPGHQDGAANTYAERRFSDERRAEFQAFAEPRGWSRETAAERMAEYLTESELRARAGEQPGARRVNVAITVIDANAPSMMSVLVPGSQIIPTLDYEFVVTDAETGAQLANGRVDDVYSLAGNINEARRRNDLEYNFSGTDQNFRTLAGQTNALAESMMTILRGSFVVSGGRSSIGTAYTGLGAFNITTANAQYMIRVTPPPPPAVGPAVAESPADPAPEQ
jgi:hypothetical protein